MKISSIGTNFQNKQQTKNLNFKSVVPVKTSEFKKMVNTYRFVTALKALAKETKNIFDVNNIVNKTYIKLVSLDSKEYLKKSFFEDPVLFMSLAKSKYSKILRNYTVDYSPEEIYGIIQTKKEDPERAYSLSKILKDSNLKGHLENLDEVMYISEKLKIQNINPSRHLSSKGLYYNLKARDVNPKLCDILAKRNDTDLKPLTYKDIFEIVQLEQDQPEFINKMVKLSKISLEDLYILEDFYKEEFHKGKIDELVDFIEAHTNEKYLNPIVSEHSSTASVLNLLSTYEKHPKAVKELIEKDLDYYTIDDLAEYYEKAPDLTMKTYRTFVSHSKYSKNRPYFVTKSDVKNFLGAAIENEDAIKAYEKAYGKLNLQKKIELVEACSGKESLSAMCKILNSQLMPKDFDIKNKMPKLIEYVKANPDKEITKDMFEYAFDPIAKDFGLV